MTIQHEEAGIRYRRMTGNDLPAAHGLSQAVRWPHRLEDWQFVLRLGTGFVADQDGTLVGIGMSWKQGKDHASVGMIIVSPQQQGKGIGRVVMNLILEELGERCVLLNATPAGQPLYERLGFKATGTIHQHQGTLLQAAPVALAAGERLRPAGANDHAALAALASRATGMERTGLVTQLLDIAQGIVLERDGEPVGFSILRRFGRGQVIGPVVAPDSDGAKALIAHWAGACAGSFVRVDITGTSGLGGFLPDLGLVQVDTGVVMARNGVPAQDDTVKQFAIASQALC